MRQLVVSSVPKWCLPMNSIAYGACGAISNSPPHDGDSPHAAMMIFSSSRDRTGRYAKPNLVQTTMQSIGADSIEGFIFQDDAPTRPGRGHRVVCISAPIPPGPNNTRRSAAYCVLYVLYFYIIYLYILLYVLFPGVHCRPTIKKT